MSEDCSWTTALFIACGLGTLKTQGVAKNRATELGLDIMSHIIKLNQQSSGRNNVFISCYEIISDEEEDVIDLIK